MGRSRTLVLCIICLLVAMSTAWCLQPCRSAEYTLDCSFLMKTTLLKSEVRTGHFVSWNLRGNLLRALPEVYGLERIDISQNELGLGDQKSLQSIRATKYVDISSNYLTDLNFLLNFLSCDILYLNASQNALTHLGAINKCRNLRELRIANNGLTNISDNVDYNTARERELLDFSSNPIQEVSSTAFGNMPQLNTLYLSETRRLSTLPENVFDGLAALQFLYLSGNALSGLHVEVFKSLVNLRILHLQRNALRTLPADVFRNLVHLRSLMLDNNQLEELPEELFSRLHSLEDLSVRSNRLFSVPQLSEVLGPLRTALLNDNLITKVDEAALRALFRHGFQFGDLRGNRISAETLEWATNNTDISFKLDDRPCGHLRLLPDHGVVAMCVWNKPREDEG